MTLDEFELRWRRYMDEGGHSYDPATVAYVREDFAAHPEKYGYCLPANSSAKE